MHSHNASVVSDQATHQHPWYTHHFWKHKNSLMLHLLSESGVSLQKSWCNINICFYNHLLRHAWRWRQYCTLKTTLSGSWLRFSTSCDHQAVRSAATCFCVLKQLQTQPAQQTGWLPSVEKTALPEIQPKNAVSLLKNNSLSPQREKKTPHKIIY